MKYKNRVLCRKCGHMTGSGVVACPSCGVRLVYKIMSATDGTVCCTLTENAENAVLGKTMFGPWKIVRLGDPVDVDGSTMKRPEFTRPAFQFPDLPGDPAPKEVQKAK